MDNRQQTIDAIREQPNVSVLIAGAGVVGAGLFRELALQGVDVLMVDRADFSAGASAGPSRMIHGGLRYLEFGEFKLVRESVTERNRLLVNAPHYVLPLPTTVPLRSWFKGLGHVLAKCVGIKTPRPKNRGAALAKIGMTIYDHFSAPTRVMPKHKFASRYEALTRRPGLEDDIVCTATYYDAWITYPERLVLEMALDSEALCPDARSLSYAAVESAHGDTVTLRDELTGDAIEVKPQIVVNAGGPWIDSLNKALGLDTAMINGTKGGHLILDNPELAKALGDEQVFYETPDGRVCIAFVWLGKAMIGSTDIRIENPDEAVCDNDETDYMLQAIRTPFPRIEVNRSQVISTFSGVRPLARSSASTTGQMSRSHRCDVTEPADGLRFPVLSMIGGKWTPFRAFAEQVTNQILLRLGLKREAMSDALSIGGGKDFPITAEARQQWIARLVERTDLSAELADRLLFRYGTRAEQVAGFMVSEQDADLRNHAGYTRREIEFILRNERVGHLDDVVLRRTSMALMGELTPALLAELAEIAQPILSWSDDQAAAEVERTVGILRNKHGIDLTDRGEEEPSNG